MNKKRTIAALAAVTVYMGATAAMKAMIKPHKRAVKPYFSSRSPYIFAHRGGMQLAPENTMAAFKEAKAFQVDGFEIDIRLTQDGEIVVFHDAYVDRVSDGSGKVSELTLEALRSLDVGYHFKDVYGNHSFRGHHDAKIVTLKDLIEAFPGMRINIDIKDAPDTTAGRRVPSQLYQLIDALDAFDHVLVTSFYAEQVQRFKHYAQDRVATGASQTEAAKAFLLFKLGLGQLYQPAIDTFQLPVHYSGIRLDNPRFISYLQRYNIAVGYWVINTIDEMDDLLTKGAHTIVTDRPDLAYHLVQEKYRK
ncbi:glycerophosphodiester phosphodiesterase [Macrococcus equipercicus]|uniref:Glycerophosphodiester phosphodiesterase n=1 Tax=Macrococcus equipercicus TaxID=69967 RepID=A0A9Q9F217_9STAP|nr:glycerophosphodiester phosphodiesterase [Macrococcus equipercicus]UTH14562.1 glycerophosphodiester phosphodiesterase [Macrococcus equipercicus]